MNNVPGTIALLLLVSVAAACGDSPAQSAPEPVAVRARDCREFEDGRPGQVTGPDMDAEVERRNEPAQWSEAARAYGEEHPEEFGGVWLDQDQTSSWLVVAFTGGLERHEAALRERLGPEARVRVQRVATSLAALERVRARVGPELESVNAETGGAILFGWGIRDNLNRVALDVVAVDERAREVLAERFGADMICLHPVDGPPRGVAPGGGAQGVRELPTSEIANMQLALHAGRLRADPATGCVWTESTLGPQSVMWPPGFGVRFTEAGAELVDHTGAVVAREGDWIEMGGGENDVELPRCKVGETVWVAGSVRVAEPPSQAPD